MTNKAITQGKPQTDSGLQDLARLAAAGNQTAGEILAALVLEDALTLNTKEA